MLADFSKLLAVGSEWVIPTANHLLYKKGGLGRYMNCAPLPPLRTKKVTKTICISVFFLL